MEDFGLWDVIVSTFWFMLLLAWIWLIISILGDIFRDRELSGGGKAMWTVFLIFLPWIGAVIYLIARGGSMNERTGRPPRPTRSGCAPMSRGSGHEERGGPADRAGGGSATTA